MGAVLRGEMTLDDAAQEIKYHTHRFIRHQYAWFHPGDRQIAWFDASQVNLASVLAASKVT
jgi:tRNA A37 N6-isopentenylltransferase MiaA